MDSNMAQGRMLKKEISNSEKLGRVKTDRARVLYFMMLPHLDIAGRLEANVRCIKGQIVTMLPYNTRAIQECLEQLDNARLIVLYENSGKKYLEYTRFGDFQTLNPDKEAKSKIPPPTPENSRVLQSTPPKLSKDKSKLSLSKGKFKPPTIDEVIEYVKTKGYQVDVKKFMDYYTESKPPWHDRDGKPVRNWKQKIIAVWNKPGGQKKCRSSGCKGLGVYTSADDTGQICWWCEAHKPNFKPSLPKELTNQVKTTPSERVNVSNERNRQKDKLSVAEGRKEYIK